MFIVKLDLGLGWVYVDIDTFRVHLEIQEITRVSLILQQAFKSRCHGMIQVRTLYEPVIDKKELFSPALFGEFGFSHESVDLYDLGILFNGHKFFIGLSPKDIHDALPEIGFRKLEQLTPVMKKGELNGRMR